MSDEPQPIITVEQGAQLWEAIRTWQEVAAAAGKPVAITQTNMMKSCLLGRLVYEGKPPLPEPPPLAYSAPWYSLIEDGVAHLSDHDVHTHCDEGHVAICQSVGWTIIEDQRPDIEGWLLTHNGTDRWMLRRYMNDETPGRAGTYADGRAVPATWLLARRPTLESTS